jgi:hypothetical protein
MIKNDAIAAKPNESKYCCNSNQKFLFMCNSFIGLPSLHDMINTKGSTYVEGKVNGFSYISSKVTIKDKVPSFHSHYKNYTSNFLPSLFH